MHSCGVSCHFAASHVFDLCSAEENLENIIFIFLYHPSRSIQTIHLHDPRAAHPATDPQLGVHQGPGVCVRAVHLHRLLAPATPPPDDVEAASMTHHGSEVSRVVHVLHSGPAVSL